MAACLCHFESVVPITAKGNLMAFIPLFLLRDDTVTLLAVYLQGPLHVAAHRDESFTMFVGAGMLEIGPGMRGDFSCRIAVTL